MKVKLIIIQDSLEEIFDALVKAVLNAKAGHHLFLDFTRLRKRGSTVTETAGIASGPVSFMKIFDDTFHFGRFHVNVYVYLHPTHPDYGEYCDVNFKHLGKYFGDEYRIEQPVPFVGV